MSNLIEVKNDILYSTAIKDYKNLTPRIVESLKDIAKKIKGASIIHVNATSVGGGVAEILMSEVSLERSLGLDSHWFVIDNAQPAFFGATKQIHNFLQSKNGKLTKEQKRVYLDTNEKLGQDLSRILKSFKKGILIIHDPQPMAIINHVPTNFYPILRLHIDLSFPNLDTLNFLEPYIKQYPLVIVSNKDYSSPLSFLPHKSLRVVYPAINPFSNKNKPMRRSIAEAILLNLGINPTLPIIAQVSRFDPWKDPLGVINAYYIVKKEIPNLQLVLAGFITAKDDPEADDVFARVVKHAKGDPDIHLFSNPRELQEISNDEFVSALYTASTVIVQKSLREGFGLTMTEAMWKGKALVAGETSGGMAQIKNGKNGFIVKSPKEAAERILKLLKDKKFRTPIGKAAKESVSENFLLSRMILDHLRLYKEALNPPQ